MPIWWRRRREAAPLASDDADAMIEDFGALALKEAREWAREARRGDGTAHGHAAEHWYRVMRLIAPRQARATGAEPAAPPHGDGSAGMPPPASSAAPRLASPPKPTSSLASQGGKK